MLQNNFDIEIPRTPTLVMGSYPSTNIAQLLHDEIVLQFGIGGCAPLEGSEPLVDPDVFLFSKVEEPASVDEIRILARFLLEAA
jgi:hypothetical protein